MPLCVSAYVCLSVCLCSHELSTPNLENVGPKRMAVARYALTPRSKGQGHAVIIRAAVVGMRVDVTA